MKFPFEANRERILKVSPEWFLAHGKNYASIVPGMSVIRKLTDKGPLKLYHMHADGWANAYWHKGGFCSRKGCFSAPPLHVVGRAIWLARGMDKHVSSFKWQKM